MLREVEQSDRAQLQKKLNHLYQEKKDLISNIKSLTRRKRLLKDHLKQHSLVGQRLDMRTMTQDPLQPKASEGKQHHQHLNEHQDEIKKAVESQNNMKERNRRLFGGLNGYLKKAEKQLKEQQSKAKQKMTIQEKVLQKERQMTSKLQQQKIKEIEQQLCKMNEKRQSIQEELLQTENIILKSKFIAYVSDLQHCLTTNTHPLIFWKPKQTNIQINKLQLTQRELLKNKTQLVVDEIMNYHQKFDYRSYSLSNEREYYNNLLDSYLANRSQFLITKAFPPILWQPNSVGKTKVTELFQQSKAAILEMGAKRKEENDQFYLKFEKTVQVEQEVEDNESQSQ